VTISSWLNFGRPATPGRGLWRGENFWLRVTTASAQCLRLLWALFFIFLAIPLLHVLCLINDSKRCHGFTVRRGKRDLCCCPVSFCPSVTSVICIHGRLKISSSFFLDPVAPSLSCALSCGAAYCNLSCLCLCVFVGGCVCVWVCYHDNSKLRASILTKLDL